MAGKMPKMDEPILKTPGELLAEARAAAGLSLAEISIRTKIPVPQLEAVERDEYHRLSGPLYVKSFLRAYAEAVGVDLEVVLDLYRRSSGEGAPTAGAAKPDVWESETVRITRVGVDWGRLLVWGAGGAVLVVGGWLLLRLLGGSQDPVPAPAGPAGPAATAAVAPAGTDSLPPVAVDRQDTLAPGWQAETPPTGRANTEPAAPLPVPAARADADRPLPAAVGGNGPIAFAGGGRWPLRIRVLMAAPVGMELRCDGARDFQALRAGDAAGAPALPARGIEPGRFYAVREGLVVYWAAQDHCELRLDGTDGVEVTVNGTVRDVRHLRPGQEQLLDAQQ